MPFEYLRFMSDLQGPGQYPVRQPQFDPPSLTPLRKPIEESTIGVFTSVGVHLLSQPPLGVTDDLSYRLIPRDVPFSELRISHETPVRVWAQQDLNVAYPRDWLLELEADRVIGRLADNAVSMVGSINLYTQLVREVVPRIKHEFDLQGVDLVFLFPV